MAERELSAQLPVRLNVRQTLVPPGEPSTENKTFHITILEYMPDFVMDAGSHGVASRSSEPDNLSWTSKAQRSDGNPTANVAPVNGQETQ